MNDISYDDAEELRRYLIGHAHLFMTDFESWSYNLAAKRAKAQHSDWLEQKLPGRLAEETEEVRQASLAGYTTIQQAFLERMEHEVQKRTVVINRCPACQRIIRTPLARQCLWCGHDWHDR